MAISLLCNFFNISYKLVYLEESTRIHQLRGRFIEIVLSLLGGDSAATVGGCKLSYVLDIFVYVHFALKDGASECV